MDQVTDLLIDDSIPLKATPISASETRSIEQPDTKIYPVTENLHCYNINRSRKRKRPREKRTKRIRTMSIVASLSALILLMIGEATAFIFISPTQSQVASRSQAEDAYNTYAFLPQCIHHRERIKSQSTSLVFRASANDDSDNKPKKKPNNTNGKKTNKSNVSKKSKGNYKYSKKGKSGNKNAKSKKPLDPSKQKKKEILDQIKAKIKQEEEEKRRKQTNKNKSNKKQSDTKQKSNSKRKTEQQPSQPTQARLQKLADEDPSESQFDNDEVPSQAEDSDEKRQRLFMNPFEAGKTFRQTLQNLSTLGRGLQLPKETKQKYFVDDRLLDGDDEPGSRNAGAYFSSSPLLQSNFNSKSANSLLQEYARAEALDPIKDYIPEVLVVGATGEIGRLVVRRLLLEGRGRFRVRVLVRDLYSQTLNLLGTGVSYCQGDLNDVESLEYSLTDVDKIVYVAGAPKPDETDFQRKFQLYLEENDIELDNNNPDNKQLNDLEWEQLSSVLEVRSELAEQVDCIGMKNLVSAYQNVRHTDYGTSQAAKRSLFKFNQNSGDFDLFALDDGEDEDDEDEDEQYGEDSGNEEYGYDDNNNDQENAYDDDPYSDNYNYDENGEYEDDKYEDVYGNYDEEMEDYGLELESRKSKDTNVVKAQVKWLKNKFNRGVFVGRVPKADASNPVSNPGGEASIIVSRLRAREDPEMGIDMSGFAGFILRLVSDGNNYEAFVRTELYETDGIEYVYEFATESKATSPDNFSNKRFKTIRLAFENFKPVQRRKLSKEDDNEDDDVTTVPAFDGSDVRYLGFRFRSSSNINERSEMQKKLDRLSKRKNDQKEGYEKFYMALSYIKVYRAQPEPEFIYLSDARIPPVIRDGMVHHERKMLLTNESLNEEKYSDESKENSSSDAATLLDEKDLQRKSMLERSPEETYFKYRGEEILIKSGLSYTIIRVAGFNELSGSEASTIDLVQSNTESNIVPVSRAEVAQVCVSALLDPSALNKCVYMTKKSVAGKNVLDEEDISAKFDGIPTDIIL